MDKKDRFDKDKLGLDDVVVHDESGVFRQDAGRWLYTALTRAKKKLTIVI